MNITLDSEYYSASALNDISLQFTDYLVVSLNEEEQLTLTLIVKAQHTQDAELIIQTFLNNALILSAQEILNHEC